MSALYLFVFQKSANFSFYISYNDRDYTKGKGNMQNIFSKKDFYSAMLRGRMPIAEAIFIFNGNRGGRLEFYCTPLGTVLCATVENDSNLKEIKMYDRHSGTFAIQNVFCGDNLIKIDQGVFVGVSSRLQIEDVIGRDFLIKTDGLSIVARAKMIEKPKVDKHARLVYN